MAAVDRSALIQGLHKLAEQQGFAAPRIASVTEPWPAAQHLHEFLALGHHGDMSWMAREAHRRQHPQDLWPGAKSAVVLGLNYGPDHDPMSSLTHKAHGNISVYARGGDYHGLVKRKLKQLAGWLHRETDQAVKVFVDTAPLMEKPLAMQAGLGWQGKHTNLVSRELGSWLFLGVILTEAILPIDEPGQDHCGSCQACVDICPTNAFIAPYQLDARACISYLTIEHQGHIPKQYRTAMGNRIYGCDDCLAVCPWNKYAQVGTESKLHARPELSLPYLADLAALDDASFRQVFAGSPVKRTGRDRFLRNVLIAIGNSNETALIPSAKRAASDPSPLVRAMAAWALSQLLSPTEFTAFANLHLADETDDEVVQEWRGG